MYLSLFCWNFKALVRAVPFGHMLAQDAQLTFVRETPH